MSVPHPTISAWARSHEGPFETELHGWQLRVSWTPNTPETRGSFRWQASRDDETRQSEESFEEMETAMAEAEHFAAADAARRTAAIAALTDHA